MKDGRACFEQWAGEHEWSDWTKPTLFAGGFTADNPSDGRAGDPLLAEGRAMLARHADAHITARGADGARNCVVVDVPGADAIAVGAVLAERGFAPVVLCNGVTVPMSANVDNAPILRSLAALGPGLAIERNPSPAFLLDSRRLEGSASPGRYDNRWITFPQDFPSAARLQAARVKRCIVLAEPERIADDLAHVLRRWQDAGIDILSAGATELARLEIKAPPWYRQVFYRSLALAGMKPNSFGGFGAMIPIITSRGGYGGFG
jgi:hypothetical protein